MRRALLAMALTALVPLGLTAAPATAAMAAAPATASAAVGLATAMPGASRAPATAQTPSPFVQQNFCQSHPTIPSTGTSGSVKVFNIKTLAKGCLAGIHACEATGNDGTNEGVMCADLYVNDGAIMPIGEGYCQSLNPDAAVQMPQCSEMVGTASLIQNTVGDVLSVGENCGHSVGSCYTGRNEWGTTGQSAGITEGGFCGNDHSADVFWGEIFAAFPNEVILPVSDVGTEPAANLASPHAIICFNP